MNEDKKHIKRCLIILVRFLKETKSYNLFRNNFNQQHQSFNNLYNGFLNETIEFWWSSFTTSFLWNKTQEKAYFWNIIFYYWCYLVCKKTRKKDYECMVKDSINIYKLYQGYNPQLKKELDYIVTNIENLFLRGKE